MHIPENYLAPATCVVTTAIVVPLWALALKKVRTELPRQKLPLLAVGAAFTFLFMMFNVPLPGGTTGHAVGGTLIAILIGPWAAALSISVALLVQALLFGDGGILSFGANSLNIAVILPFVGYYVYKFISDRVDGARGRAIGAAVGAYLSLNAAALFTALELGLQAILFQGADGRPLYFPYPPSVSVPAMMIPHLVVAGFVDSLFTVAILAFLERVSPGTIQEGAKTRAGALYGIIVALVIATPLGLLATGEAWGEWAIEDIAKSSADGRTPLGFVPSGMQQGFSLASIFPDYTIPGLGEIPGYVLSAVAAIAIFVILFKLLAAAWKRGSAKAAGQAAGQV